MSSQWMSDSVYSISIKSGLCHYIHSVNLHTGDTPHVYWSLLLGRIFCIAVFAAMNDVSKHSCNSNLIVSARLLSDNGAQNEMETNTYSVT